MMKETRNTGDGTMKMHALGKVEQIETTEDGALMRVANEDTSWNLNTDAGAAVVYNVAGCAHAMQSVAVGDRVAVAGADRPYDDSHDAYALDIIPADSLGL